MRAGDSAVRVAYFLGTLSDVLDLLEELLVSLTAFSGLATESMTCAARAGASWSWAGGWSARPHHQPAAQHAGRRLAGEGPLLEAVLEVAESSMTYRRRYLGSLQAAPVLDLLVADETNRARWPSS